MKRCCVNCFNDIHLKTFVKENGDVGRCSYCGSMDVLSIEVNKARDISEMITRLIQSYSVSDDKRAKKLSSILRDDWYIFNSSVEDVIGLTKDLCADYISVDDELYSKNVWIPQMYEYDFVNDYCITRNYSWKDFSNYIKSVNRFHSERFNPDAFASFLSATIRMIRPHEEMFRARLCDKGAKGYSIKKMGMPPEDKRSAGRINPEGIGVLYLSLDPETVLYEVRASKYDRISIGHFKAVRDIRVVDLSMIEVISPFSFGEGDDMIERCALNKGVFKDIAFELAQPMRRTDSVLDYLPTQFISEYVKYQGYDGVAYKSTVHDGGYNIALFEESLVQCQSVETIEIKDICYRK